MITDHPPSADTSYRANGRRTRRSVLLAFICLFAITGVVSTFIYGRHYIYPKRFAEVEPGRLYRSGLMETWPMERMFDLYHFKTILTLLVDEPDNRPQAKERTMADQKGIKILRIPMPGNGLAAFDDLDRAADIMADASRYPILIHCAAGVQRTGAVYAAYRMKHCGWDFDRAIQEGERYGCSLADHSELVAHLRNYLSIHLQRTLTSNRSSP